MTLFYGVDRGKTSLKPTKCLIGLLYDFTTILPCFMTNIGPQHARRPAKDRIWSGLVKHHGLICLYEPYMMVDQEGFGFEIY